MKDINVITGDCLKVLPTIERESVKLIFADSPYNIGIVYGDHHDDNVSPEQFMRWVELWMVECHRVLAPDGSMWLLINDEYAAEFVVAMKRLGFTMRNWVKWYETFGVNMTKKFNRTSRHLLYFCMSAKDRVFHREAVSRPSDRQVKYNDSRANPAGKILDDVWTDIPRVCGTFKERIAEFPTQLPIKLTNRIVGACSDPGGLVCDPFAGSGTSGASCVWLGRRYIGIELGEKFAELSRQRLSREWEEMNDLAASMEGGM